MNFKLIIQLSIFGLVMAFATISLIPEKIEFYFWLVIFVVNAYIIAKKCAGKYFLHGFAVSMVNSVWITIAHVSFFLTYTAHHPDMAKMSEHAGYFITHPRQLMLILSPAFGAMFGLAQGLFAWIASLIVKK